MPEYLAPGVYVEEVSFRARSIEGVSTTTTGFVGPTRYGAVDEEPEIVTSLSEFEANYGDMQRLQYGQVAMDNYVAHAVRAFFENGGKRLYVARVFRGFKIDQGENPGTDSLGRSLAPDGKASAAFTGTIGDSAANLTVGARFPGAAGNLRVSFTINVGQNILGQSRPGSTAATIRGLRERDIVLISDTVSPVSPLATAIARATFDQAQGRWHFVDPVGTVVSTLDNLQFSTNPRQSDFVRILTLTITVDPADGTGTPWTYGDLAPDTNHLRDGAPDSLLEKFRPDTTSLIDARTNPVVMSATGLRDGADLLELLLTQDSNLRTALSNDAATPAMRTLPLTLFGGNDGQRPEVEEYEGQDLSEPPGGDPTIPTKKVRTGLLALEDIEDISIVAAPGSTWGYESSSYTSKALAIVGMVISHAERMRYRIAVIDSGNNQSISQVRAMKAKLDSSHAALYFPWVRIVDPVTRKDTFMPPSGFVCGIYARSDVQRAVYKAPANEVVSLAIGFEQLLNKSQQDVLNPEGINCFRFFEGRGYRLWGARTTSSDSEWKYVNLRRYFAFLERSIDRGTQWAVFEPNGERLWANMRFTISDFLFDQWSNGALLGDKPEKAFFVKCDRSTMTQNDIDNGRLVCLVGVAALRPAEFVIIRIGQWTASART